VVDDKETTRKLMEEKEEKEKKRPFWETTPPVVLVFGLILCYLAFNQIVAGNKTAMWILIGLGVIFFLMRKPEVNKERVLSPREAELLVERELIRKQKWNQLPVMSEYSVGPVIDGKHTDARGNYYDVGVVIKNPYDKNVYYTAKVIMSGPEITYTTFVESIGPVTGRKIQQERTVTKTPMWLQDAKREPILTKLFFGTR